ncbi:RNase A-like domain-containing protein [Lyticum sinuosum]|uniref:Bacterial CdiA-CT RNAse A domain-containing protein n=1 Tax=Lyticum sinuosum TaxID=1332059 RepID=A0AAE5AHV7_9RICK|nr:RNase A-like domain-containing protein [Lyticum sinuosum]MDZ5761446.1 hypothetical protein [Lyticum sinuosum]
MYKFNLRKKKYFLVIFFVFYYININIPILFAKNDEAINIDDKSLTKISFPLEKIEEIINSFNLKENDSNHKNAKTISKHVEKSYDWLKNNINELKSPKKRIQVKSSFSSLKTADQTIKEALIHNKNKIYEWINFNKCIFNKKKTNKAKRKCDSIRLIYNAQSNVGYGIIQYIIENENLPKSPIIKNYETNTIVVILKKDLQNVSNPFYVLSAYPYQTKKNLQNKELNNEK